MNFQAIHDEIDITVALFDGLPDNEKNNKVVHSVNAYLKKLYTKSKKTYPWIPSVQRIIHHEERSMSEYMWLELSSQYVNDYCHENDEFLQNLIHETVATHKKAFILNWVAEMKQEDFISYGRAQVGDAPYTRAMLKKDMLRNFDQDAQYGVEESMLREAWSCDEQSNEDEDE
jgi:hypothetical protein